SDLYDEFGLRDAFLDQLIDLLTVEGAIYSIPSNIHRANVVWANPEVLEDAGVDPEEPPSDLDAWISDLKKVQDAGYTAPSVAEPWAQVHLLAPVLLAALGAEGSKGLWDGSGDWSSSEVTDALKDFDTLMGLTIDDRDGLDWPGATQMI